MDILNALLQLAEKTWFIVPLFCIVLFLKSRLFKGFLGEFHINRLLSKLDRVNYKLFKDVTLPTESGTTQIDHIVISRFGIFVIETKNMKGWIFGSARKKKWIQKLYNHSFTFQNPLHQNKKHTGTLKALLKCNETDIHSVVVFIGDSEFKTDMPENVTQGKDCIKYIQQYKQIIFSEEEYSLLIKSLKKAKLRRGIITNIKHLLYIRNIITRKKVIKICPSCGAKMVKRVATKGKYQGEKFWGCSTFPKCRAVEQFRTK